MANIAFAEKITNMKNICQQVFQGLYASRIEQLENGNNSEKLLLQRTEEHYAFWWQNLAWIKDCDNPELIKSRRGIFKVFGELPEEDAKKFLMQLRTTFEKHETFIMLAMVLHDLGKFIQDQNHNLISYDKYIELQADNFQSLKSTAVYNALITLSVEEQYVMGMLIKYHAIGGLTYEGNLGIIQRLKNEYAQVEKMPWSEFMDIMICFSALDKASVANSTNDGFLSFYDINRLELMLKTDYKIDSLNIWAEMVTNQFIMNHTYKQQAYNFYYPHFEQMTNLYFDVDKDSFLQKLQAGSEQALDFGYINNYLLNLAWGDEWLDEKKPRASVAEKEIIKSEDFHLDKDILQRFLMAKTAVVLFYPQEQADIETLSFFDSGKDKNQRTVFAFDVTYRFYVAIKRFLRGNKITKILRLP